MWMCMMQVVLARIEVYGCGYCILYPCDAWHRLNVKLGYVYVCTLQLPMVVAVLALVAVSVAVAVAYHPVVAI